MKIVSASLLSLAFLALALPAVAAAGVETVVPPRCVTTYQGEACAYYDPITRCQVVSARTFAYDYYATATVPSNTIWLPSAGVGPVTVDGGSVILRGFTSTTYLFSTSAFGRSVQVCETDGVVLA